jgi:hypothetical protein
LLNVLAFRLVLAVGVDYGIYVLLVWQKARQLDHDVAGVVKPVILAWTHRRSQGFGALGLANNPTLAGLWALLRYRHLLEPRRDGIFLAARSRGG